MTPAIAGAVMLGWCAVLVAYALVISPHAETTKAPPTRDRWGAAVASAPPPAYAAGSSPDVTFTGTCEPPAGFAATALLIRMP